MGQELNVKQQLSGSAITAATSATEGATGAATSGVASNGTTGSSATGSSDCSRDFEVLEVQFHAPQPGPAPIANLLQSSAVPPANPWLAFADGSSAAVVNRIVVSQLCDVRFAASCLTLITSTRIDSAADELASMQTRIEAESPADSAAPVLSVLLTLQGAHVLWQPTRIAIVAASHRLPAVIRAIVEATWRESQLRTLEAALDAVWAHVADDASMAFEFTERHVSKRQELSNRLQTILGFRMLTTQLSQHVLVPHVYPPTLASQIDERLRERTRMAERLEIVQTKLEAQERVYDMCGQRASDFMTARHGHHLEWAIIIILLAQTVLVIIELLSTSTT